MNEEDRGKGYAWIWVIALVALPVVYLLSVPPVFVMTWRLNGMGSPPPWLNTYGKPYDWLAEKTVLKEPLQYYARFWIERFMIGV